MRPVLLSFDIDRILRARGSVLYNTTIIVRSIPYEFYYRSAAPLSVFWGSPKRRPRRTPAARSPPPDCVYARTYKIVFTNRPPTISRKIFVFLSSLVLLYTVFSRFSSVEEKKKNNFIPVRPNKNWKYPTISNTFEYRWAVDIYIQWKSQVFIRLYDSWQKLYSKINKPICRIDFPTFPNY